MDISVIIPCYNTSSIFLYEAINSVFAYNGIYSYEIIIVDDGSDDTDTIETLQTLGKKEKVDVYYQLHKGGAAARNYAVKQCHGEFLLCLDSDNKIKPGYIDSSIKALSANEAAGVAYGKPNFFGDANREYFVTTPFNIEKLLADNFIDMCAVIRKKAWEDVNGMDENLNCYEDWELWIHIAKKGWEFIFLDEVLYDYRIRLNSVMSNVDCEKFANTIAIIFKKHSDILYSTYQNLYAAKSV